MLNKEIIEEVLLCASQTGGDFAQLFIENKRKNSIRLLDNKVDSNAFNLDCGAGLRITHGLDSYYGYTSDLTKEGLMKLALDLRSSIDDECKIKELKLKEIEYEMHHQAKVPFESVPLKDKIALMKKASDSAFKYSDLIYKVIVNYLDETQDVLICDTTGKYIKDHRNRTRIFVTSMAKDGDLMQDGYASKGASEGFEFYNHIDVEDIAKEASRIASVMLYADDCPSGIMPVVIDNGFGGVIFHEACGHALEATAVAKNQSVFSDKFNQKIANELVTAIDDATIENAWGSANIDDDGNFTKCNTLIKDGILNSYLIDTHNAKRMNTKDTSSSRRQSYRYEPTSRMSNTFIANGTSTFDEIIQATKYGLYAKNMGGGSVDPSTGEFNFAVMEAYLIEDGKITKPVKGASIIGNGSDTLKKIDMVGNNLSRAQGMCGSISGSIPTDVGEPTIRVMDMTVGGSAHE